MSIEKLKAVPGMDVEQGVRNCMDDNDLYVSILEMYITQLKDNIPQLSDQLAAGDATEYGKTCHSIKGASASVGAVAIQSASAELEAAGKNGDSATISAKHEEFVSLLQTAVKELSAASSWS